MTAADLTADAAAPDLTRTAPVTRFFGWASLGALLVLLVNNYLQFWLGWPGAGAVLDDPGGAPLLAWLQMAFWIGGVLGFGYWGLARSQSRSLREECATVSDINAFVIRAAFWAVVFVGVGDTIISFLRIENLLPGIVGEELTTALGRSSFRGAYVHWPLVALAIVTAMLTRTLGFIWLALLVVIAELIIVLARFVFSYEQAFMADLVRFWYAALFLFASAYTLLEEGHVRVDVFYAAFSARMKGRVNAVGTLLLGMTLVWTILIIGTAGKSSIINSPLLSYEVTQAGFGLYVKYFMAGFLAVFASSMLIQFVSYLFDAVADIRGEPGGRDHESHATA